MVMGEHEKRLHELSLIALADSNPGSLCLLYTSDAADE